MRFAAGLSLLLLALGCDPDPVSEDAGARMDAGAGRDAGDDAAAPRDAGAAGDAATPDDAGTSVDAGPGDDAGPGSLSVLVFSKTTGFRHGSIGDGITALNELAADRGWAIDDTEDASRISTAGLADVDVLVFLSTTGDPLDDTQQAALEAWVRGGGGWVGIHAAADCEYGWPWYQELVGAWFARHPAIQDATLEVEDRAHPTTAHLDATWMRNDEWYDFQRNPRPFVDVLITIDESTYSGASMGADHPMTWLHEVDAGRSFYTAFGHTSATYSEPEFRTMLAEAVEWAAGD